MLFSFCGLAETTLIKNPTEFAAANAKAQPGDELVLENSQWSNAQLVVSCKGTAAQPIVVRAQTPGGVVFTGHSSLAISGEFIVIDGFYFLNGFAGDKPVVKFADQKLVANHCRLTNTVINSYNNPKRLSENYWVALYGKHNRVDHCSFLNKTNMGVLMAVILDDDRSRQNFHQIDHNYFGLRLPLASNTGEIIRVGVSEHCQFESNTQIVDNMFEHCDGETEIISIKSGSNLVRNNYFKECQGGVVLRHGNNNTVEGNLFFGNGKPGTGGVRIINEGQWVVNNLFYKCRGQGFRAPLSIMNGIPNSPANRYLAVRDALVCNNSFYDCAPLSFCEGADAERSIPPSGVSFFNNIIYSASGANVYKAFDSLGGFHFQRNVINKSITQALPGGFVKTAITSKSLANFSFPNPGQVALNLPPLEVATRPNPRLAQTPSAVPGILNAEHFKTLVLTNAPKCGAPFSYAMPPAPAAAKAVDCADAAEVVAQLMRPADQPVAIRLTGPRYSFTAPLVVSGTVSITGVTKAGVLWQVAAPAQDFAIQLAPGANLSVKNVVFNLEGVNTAVFISTDTSGAARHANFSMRQCEVSNLNGVFFSAAKTSVCDSIVVRACSFSAMTGTLFSLAAETDKRGYYNVENISISQSGFKNIKGQLLALARTGTDESTMGPALSFMQNLVTDCHTGSDLALIDLNGVQISTIGRNAFERANTDKLLIQYRDAVKATHLVERNLFSRSGTCATNAYVTMQENAIQ